MSFPALTALAQTNEYWRNSAGGDFEDANNWSPDPGHTDPAAGPPDDPPGTVPGPSDRAVFDLPSTYSVSLGESHATGDAQVVGGNVTFLLGEKIWSTGATFSVLAPSVTGGVTAKATVTGGTIHADTLLVGAGDSLNNGTLTLSGATLSSAAFFVGQQGTGTLNLNGGTSLSTTPASPSGVGIGGQGGSQGTVNVAGGSTWTIGPNGMLQVGGFGASAHGTLNITGGTVSAASMSAGGFDSTHGFVTVTGGSSLLSITGGIKIGSVSEGVMNILAGGHVTSSPDSLSGVGSSANGNGSVTISGGGSTWTVGELGVGADGAFGIVTVSNGGLLDAKNTVTIQKNGQLDVQSTGGFSGTGLFVQDGGSGALAGTVTADTIEVSGGGTINQSGTLTADEITVTGVGSSFHQTGNGVTIDDGAGIGKLTITDGGAYYGGPTVALSDSGTAAAIIRVSGSGSIWDIGDISHFGAGGGLATVTVEQGGAIAASDLFIGDLSDAILEISHTGSMLTSTGSVFVAGTLTGAADAGITGHVAVNTGASAGIAGVLKVWGGGTVEVGGSLSAGGVSLVGGLLEVYPGGGVLSAGALSVTNGGVYSTTGTLSLGPGGNFANASVSGAARIEASSVQVSGGATLAVSDSGIVSSGINVGSGGTLQFQNGAAAGGNAIQSNGGSIRFLDTSTADAARIEVYGSGDLDISPHAAPGLALGTIDGTGSVFLGANNLTVGGGMNSDFFGSLKDGGSSGGAGGSLTKSGFGTLRLLGVNTYTGPTLVNGGTLSVEKNGTTSFGTLGSGPVTVEGALTMGANAGTLRFREIAGAGAGSFTVNGGEVSFSDHSTAGSGAFTVKAGHVAGTHSGTVSFGDSSSAGSSTITNDGSAFAGDLFDGKGGGLTIFEDDSTAANATLVANGGTGGGAGAAIVFLDDSLGGAARVKVYGNGLLAIGDHASPGVSIGSLEGNGDVFLGANTLTVGAGDLGATFAGVLHDGGSFEKIGIGTVILAGANAYTGPTTLSAGTLLVNGDDSAATGAVTVTGGILGGTGVLGGATTIGSGAALSPGSSPGALTFNSNLSLAAGSTAIFEGFDLVHVNGALGLGSDWTLTLTTGFQDGGSMTLFTYSTLAESPDLTPTFDIAGLGFTPGGPLTLTDDGAGSIVLHGVSAVPEPSTVALLLLGGAFALSQRARRRN